MHAYIAPSSAARTVACPGSVALCALFPEEPTIVSAEGDAAHWAGAEMIRGDVVAVGQVAANGVTLTDVLIDSATVYAEHVLSRHTTYDRLTETPIRSDALHPLNWGTPDNVEFGPLTIYIDDFKNGHGYVDVYENWQLMNYAALKLADLTLRYSWDHIKQLTVVLTIIQPRCYHRGSPVRSWTVTVAQLQPYFEIMRKQFAIAALPNAPCIVNSECENCSGRHACEALSASGYKAADKGYSVVPLVLSPTAVGLELKMLKQAQKQLEARVTGLEAQAERAIRGGAHVPYFGIGHGDGRTVWGVTAPEVLALGEMLGASFAKPDTITPLQAIAVLKKIGVPANVIEAYSRRLSGPARLVEIEDNAAARVFS